MGMKVLVVGSGFEAIYSAYFLRKEVGADVTMVEHHNGFGGVMSGTIHEGVAIDYGCQVFDNFDVSVTQAIQELGKGKLSGLNVSYAGRFHGEISYDMSCPDLSHMPQDILDKFAEEIIVSSPKDSSISDSLLEYYEGRWGVTAARYLERVNQKIYGLAADQLDQHCRIYSGLKRIKLLDNDTGKSLKEHSSRIDDCLAVSRDTSQPFYPEAFDYLPYTNLHPIPKGFWGYTQDARDTIEEAGIQLMMNTEVHFSKTFEQDRKVSLKDKNSQALSEDDYDLILWTGSVLNLEDKLFQTSELSGFVKPLGMHLVYCFAKPEQLSDLGFLQNFDSDKKLYRWSSIGKYSKQITENGLTYCCIEVPGYGKSENSEELIQELWKEATELGLVEGEYNSNSSFYLFAPGCFNCFQLGFTQKYNSFKRNTQKRYPHLIHLEAHTFGRIPGALELKSKLENWIKKNEHKN